MNKNTYIICLYIFLSAWAKGDTVIVVTNNVLDLNPQRDEISAVAGTPLRLTAFLNNGAEPLDMTTARFPVSLTMFHRDDGYTNRIVQSIDGSASNNYARWRWNLDYPGAYHIQASAVFEADTFMIIDRWLTVTSPVTAAATFNITNNISANVNITNVVSSALNIYYWGTNVASITNGP